MDGFVTVNGHKVHYVEYGSGKPVFNIHGYEVDHRMMTGALEPIFERREGYRRIYVDLPGFGQTPGVGRLLSRRRGAYRGFSEGKPGKG